MANVAALASAAAAASQRSGCWWAQRGEVEVVSMREKSKVNRLEKKIYKAWLQPRCRVPCEQAGLEGCCMLMVLRGCW